MVGKPLEYPQQEEHNLEELFRQDRKIRKKFCTAKFC